MKHTLRATCKRAFALRSSGFRSSQLEQLADYKRVAIVLASGKQAGMYGRHEVTPHLKLELSKRLGFDRAARVKATASVVVVGVLPRRSCWHERTEQAVRFAKRTGSEVERVARS